MKKLTQWLFGDLNMWIKAHPYKALGFNWAFMMISTCMVASNEEGCWCGVAVTAVIAAVGGIVVYRDLKKLKKTLAVLLAFIIAMTATAQEQPPEAIPVGPAVTVVVLCVVGVCVVLAVPSCKKIAAKLKTPATNAVEQLTGLSPQGDEDAASWNFGDHGSCDPTLPPPEFAAVTPNGPPTVFTVDVRVDEEGNVTTATHATIGEHAIQTWEQFMAEVATHGIFISGLPDNTQYFSRNRVPCRPEDVPISFDALTGTVEIKDGSGPVKLIEIERSRDLQNWSPFLRTRVGAGGRALRIEDATTSASMFYKVKVSD